MRNTFVRGEHSSDGKSDLSTRRSVPMADRLPRELETLVAPHRLRGDDDLVFAHPHTGKPLDRSKVTKRFKAACRDAGVRPIRFHDLRHTFGTRLAASGESMRTIQEFLGHADARRPRSTPTTRPPSTRSRWSTAPSPSASHGTIHGTN